MMQVFREPKNFETEKWNYLSIGYHKGKAIVKNELGELFFMECEEEVAPIGTVVTADLLTTIGNDSGTCVFLAGKTGNDC